MPWKFASASTVRCASHCTELTVRLRCVLVREYSQLMGTCLLLMQTAIWAPSTNSATYRCRPTLPTVFVSWSSTRKRTRMGLPCSAERCMSCIVRCVSRALFLFHLPLCGMDGTHACERTSLPMALCSCYGTHYTLLERPSVAGRFSSVLRSWRGRILDGSICPVESRWCTVISFLHVSRMVATILNHIFSVSIYDSLSPAGAGAGPPSLTIAAHRLTDSIATDTDGSSQDASNKNSISRAPSCIAAAPLCNHSGGTIPSTAHVRSVAPSDSVQDFNTIWSHRRM